MLIFSVSLCFGSSHSCFQIKSCGYRDGLSVKLKYLDSYDCNINHIRFVISLEDSHFGSRKTCLFHTKTNPKEIGVDISIFLGSSVLY